MSRNTGNRYRLPTEWEWEWAAAGPHGWRYPWGDQFDKDRCNSAESDVEGTTPVGSYLAGNSLWGAMDMSGNVWEIASGAAVTAVTVAGAGVAVVGAGVAAGAGIGVVVVAAGVAGVGAGAGVAGSAAIEVRKGVLRGGAWNTPSDEATCFYRRDVTDIKFVGFRCLKEV